MFDEKSTKKLLKQENREFEIASTEAIGLEKNELDFFNQIHQKINSQVNKIVDDAPKSVASKKMIVSEFNQQKRQLKKNTTMDFKNGQESL